MGDVLSLVVLFGVAMSSVAIMSCNEWMLVVIKVSEEKKKRLWEK